MTINTVTTPYLNFIDNHIEHPLREIAKLDWSGGLDLASINYWDVYVDVNVNGLIINHVV